MRAQRPKGSISAGTRSWALWAAFGAGCAIQLNLLGEIYIGEVFALAAWPILMHARAIRASSMWLLLAGAIFSLAQLISDLYNATPPGSALKGILAPIVFCTTITVFLTIFQRGERRTYALLFGVAFSQFVQIAFWPTENQLYQPWKWGYGSAVLMAGLLWFSIRPPKHVAVLLVAMLAFAAVSVLNDARSLAGLPLIGVAAYAAWRSNYFSAFKTWLLRGKAPIKLVTLLLPLVIIANLALGLLFTSDWLQSALSPSAAAKYRQQAQSDVGLLLAGRSEWLVSIKAFLDAPLLGHGSWAEDKSGYLNDYAYLRFKYGIADVAEAQFQHQLIPSHSFLFGAMVWAGAVGGLFWILFSYRLVSKYVDSAKFLPVYFHVGLVLFLWDLLFSPFGAQSRWATSLFAAALLAASQPPGIKCNSRSSPATSAVIVRRMDKE